MSHPFGNDQDAGYRAPNPNAMSPRRQQAIDEFPFLQGLLPGTPSESWLLPANSITYSLTPQQREAIWDALVPSGTPSITACHSPAYSPGN